MWKTQVCPVCGKTFVPKVPNQVYCNAACSYKAEKARKAAPPTEKRIRKCPVCGKEIVLTTSHIHVYCSKECKKEAERRRSQKRREEQKSRGAPAPAPAPKPKKRHPHRTPLEQLAYEAAEHRMSYGRYIAWKALHK